MFGFFKRRDRSAEPVAPGTRVEEVPLTAREFDDEILRAARRLPLQKGLRI